jgi:hypothetical protein
VKTVLQEKKDLIIASQNLCCTNCMKKFETISLNQLTVQRQVADMSENVKLSFLRHSAGVFTNLWLLMIHCTSPCTSVCVSMWHNI